MKWPKILDDFKDIENDLIDAGKKLIYGLNISTTKESILGYEA